MNTQAWHPDVTVAAICEHNGKFLLVEERSKTNNQIVFNQPAGHLDKGETLIQAVIRETREETCRHFAPQDIIGLYRLELESGKTYIRYTFTGTISDIDNSLELDPDIINTHWLDIEEIRSHNALRSPLVLSCINDYLNGVRYPLDLLKELPQTT